MSYFVVKGGILMSGIFDAVYTWFNQFIAVMSGFGIVDLLDILAVAYIIYKLIQLVRQTRAKQLVFGVLMILAVWIVANWLNMISLKTILRSVLGQGVLALAIIFQPEIRSALELVSRSNFSPLNRKSTGNQNHVMSCIDSVCRACQSFQNTRTGALIVFERNTMLGDIVKSGTIVDADAGSELIGNIFFPNTPLHDGAMIIRNGRIHAAGCILPLTQNNDVKKELGTRHRAALGMSENSDAVIVVVSEETGNISVAVGGVLTRDYDVVKLKSLLESKLVENVESESKVSVFKRIFGTGGKKDNE
jgi:diadenylate cyclase